MQLQDLLRLKEEKVASIAVCLPALNEQATIAPICRRITENLMAASGIVDELVVIDSSSEDATAERAAKAGARVVQAAAVLPGLPPARGKGEALWKALAVVDSDLIVYLDSDVKNFHEGFVLSLVEPLLIDDSVSFVKAFYERPMEADARVTGGRVTELVARPLLDLFFPELGGIVQPLAGEYSARTSLLKRLPFVTGYGVEIGLLIDVLRVEGLDSIAQVDLGERIHRNRPLHQLAPMAKEIMNVVFARLEDEGRAKFADLPTQQSRIDERPPMAEIL